MSLSLLSPEARLLLLAVHDSPSLESIDSVLNDPGLDWNRLAALAEREKATAILWSALRPHQQRFDAGRARQLSMLAAVSDFRMTHHEKLLGGALDRLEAIGAHVILLKGAALAAGTYGSFARRPMYDLDLLVDRADGERAWNALRSDGWMHDEVECPAGFYEEHYHLPPLDDASGTGLALELHTRPWQGGVKVTAEEIRNDAQLVQLGSRPVWVPSTTHQVLHLAAHFAWGHMLRAAAWRTIRDLRALIDSGNIDWDDVVAAARKSGGSTCCFWTFDIARSLAGVSIPAEVLAALQPRLPRAAIAMLRRHYVGTLFDFSPTPCPSQQLDRALWTAGHTVGWQDLGTLRPWSRNADWALHAKASPPLGLHQRLSIHLSGIRSWAEYLRSVMLTPPKA